ncbi:serpentine type 7TM GPCR chemoreceptor srd domain-containing protein [Ditylenchus destructor]|nr:serpentine type 7TM GPCR chemoreceptor srd domain-containing protein [Ditylenchus destructor]
MLVDLRLVHNVVDFIVCFFAAAANALLISLILTRTTKDFKPYSRLLLWCSIVDMLYALTPFSSPRIIVSHGSFFILADGLMHHFGINLNAFCILLVLVVVALAMFCVVIQFIFRYFLLCRGRSLSDKEMGAFYLVAVIFSIIVWLGSVWCTSPFEEKMREHAWKLQEDSMWANDMPNFVVFSIDDPKTIILISAAVAFSLIISGIVIFVNIAIARQLRDVQKLSPQTAKMQRQLTKVLMTQVTIPVISFCFPFLGFIVSVIISAAEQTSTNVTIVACMISASICILNPIATIYLVPQYRKAVESFICARKIMPNFGGSQQIKMVTPSVQSCPTKSRSK